MHTRYYPLRAYAAGVECVFYPCSLARKGRVVGRICLFVCLCVQSFFACSGVLNRFEVSISLREIALVNKLAFLCSVFQSDHPEAMKSFCSGQ